VSGGKFRRRGIDKAREMKEPALEGAIATEGPAPAGRLARLCVGFVGTGDSPVQLLVSPGRSKAGADCKVVA
jgi:hypothetical protein